MYEYFSNCLLIICLNQLEFFFFFKTFKMFSLHVTCFRYNNITKRAKNAQLKTSISTIMWLMCSLSVDVLHALKELINLNQVVREPQMSKNGKNCMLFLIIFFLVQQCETPSKRISIKHLFLPLGNKYRQFKKIYTQNYQKLFFATIIWPSM